MRKQQSYQNRNKGFFGKVINRIKAVFTTKKPINRITKTVRNESKPSPKRIRRRRRIISIFSCKPKSTNSFLKQAANSKKLHGHLWNGSSKIVEVLL